LLAFFPSVLTDGKEDALFYAGKQCTKQYRVQYSINKTLYLVTKTCCEFRNRDVFSITSGQVAGRQFAPVWRS
jgi:hypothetical protein